MSKKQVEVTCPCCSSRLSIDVLTETVYRTLRPEQLDESGKAVVEERDWDQALGKVQKRDQESTDKMDAFLERERNRETDLEDKFREARKKLDE